MTKDEMIMLSATILYAQQKPRSWPAREEDTMAMAVEEAERLWLTVLRVNK